MKTTAQAVIQTIVEQRSVHDTHKYLSVIYNVCQNLVSIGSQYPILPNTLSSLKFPRTWWRFMNKILKDTFSR